MVSISTSAVLAALSVCACAAATTDRPIIGILALPVEHGDCITFASSPLFDSSNPLASPGHGMNSCFHSLYSKWLEAAGARVVPLPYDTPHAELLETVSHLNGLLFTGGETMITDTMSTYMRTASLLLNETLRANADGEHVPLWAT